MLAIYLYREGARTLRITSDKDEIWMGSHADADIKLDGVLARHCKLVVRAAGCLLVNEAGTVHVNGKPLDKSTPLYATDKVYVGAYSFMIEMLERAPDPTEEKLLADITAGDDASRQLRRLARAPWRRPPRRVLRTQELMRSCRPHAGPRARTVRSSVAPLLRSRRSSIRADARRGSPVEDARFTCLRFRVPEAWSAGRTGPLDIRDATCAASRSLAPRCRCAPACRGRCVAIDIANENARPDSIAAAMIVMIAPR